MRYIGLILALGAICWVLYQAAGGGDAETVIPAEYQKSLNTAKGVEDAMQDAARKSMEEAEKESSGN
jgi:preprotein translocase subunit SecG